MGSFERLRERVIRADAAVDASVERRRGNRGLDRLMYAASEVGDHSLVWHVLGVTQALRHHGDPALAVRTATILGLESALVNGAVKSMFRRHRPVWEDERPRPHRVRTPTTSSFPSGHASSAFTAAAVLSAVDPRLRPAYYALASVVAVSRVHVKMHHASDVLAGAVLGAALGAAANRMWPAP